MIGMVFPGKNRAGFLKRYFFLFLAALFFLLPSFSFGVENLLLTSANVRFQGTAAGDVAGRMVAGRTDLNGDDIPDLIISSPRAPGGNIEGKVYLWFGADLSSGNVVLENADTIIGSSGAFLELGKVLAAGGDINGDGFDDLAIGSFLLAASDTRVRIFLGNSTFPASLAVGDADFYYTNSEFNRDTELPRFFSLGGDVNGDGYDDILLGADFDDGLQVDSGQAFLHYGRADFSGFSTINLDSSPPVDVVFRGTQNGGHAGYNVSIIPDINGDGLDDILIGAVDDSSNPIAAGEQRAYLIYGEKDGLFSGLSGQFFDLSQADAILSGNGDDGFGEQVTGLGDIDGDGYGDFAIGAPLYNSDAGAVYIYYGGSGFPYSGTLSDSGYAAIFTGSSASAMAGYHAVAPAGDVNGDGLQDTIIGEYKRTGQTGKAYVVFGNASRWTGQISLDTSDLIITGHQTTSQTGYSVSSAGDVDSDGIDEFLIGAPGSDTPSLNAGIAGLFQYAVNVTPDVIGGSPSMEVEDLGGNGISSAKNLAFIRVRLTGTDMAAGTRNVAVVEASSGTITSNARFRLIETGVNSGIFEGIVQVVKFRSKDAVKQVGAGVGDTITFQAVDNPALQATVTVENTPPSADSVTATQEGLGSETRVRIDYTVYDGDWDPVTFASPGQVQFCEAAGSICSGPWQDATVTGDISGLRSSPFGVDHHSDFEPLYWDMVADVGVTDSGYLIRIRPNDGTDDALFYATSNVVFVDNTPPAMPVIGQLPTKHAFNITVTGNAEANSMVFIYVADASLSTVQLAATGNADSMGHFSIFPVTVSSTLDRLQAVAEDPVGNRSVTSNTVTVSFGPLTRTFSDSGLTVELSLPFGAVTSDAEILFSRKTPASLQSENGNPPQFYDYITGFDLNVDNGLSVTSLSGNATVNVTLANAFPDGQFVTVNFRDTASIPPTWSVSGITLGPVTPSTIVWNSDRLGRFSISEVTDTTPPLIGNLMIDGQPVVTGNFYSSAPLLSFLLTDNEGGISSWSMEVRDDQNAIVGQSSQSGLGGVAQTTAELDITLPGEGVYTASVTVFQNGLFSSSASQSFTVEDEFVFSVIAAPNPFNPATDSSGLVVAYNLSQPADEVVFHLANLRRDIIWTFQADTDERAAGYHRVQWNGRDTFGSTVPNGLYYLYCIAKGQDQTIKKKVKILVLQ